METAQITKPENRGKDSKKGSARRSLNPGKTSKDLRGESNGKRGHASEAFQVTGVLSTTAETSDAVIASIQKHRLPKSGSKSKAKNVSMSKNSQSKTKIGKTDIMTNPEDQKQIDAQDKASELIVQTVGDFSQNKEQSHMKNTRSKTRLQQKSKSKSQKKATEEINSENKQSKKKNASQTVQKENLKSVGKSSTKSVAKSVTKSKQKSKEKSKEKSKQKSKGKASGKKVQSSELKRNKIDTDLTNDEMTGNEEVKSVKKSSAKSTTRSKKNKQSNE